MVCATGAGIRMILGIKDTAFSMNSADACLPHRCAVVRLQFAQHCIFSLLCCGKISKAVGQHAALELQSCDCLPNEFMSDGVNTSHG